MRSLLLTGGTGFFGKSVLDAFQRGLLDFFEIDQITVVSRRASNLLVQAPRLCGERVRLVDRDILELESVFDADIVIHAAASSDVKRYGDDQAGDIRIIIEGTQRLWQLAARSRRQPRMLYVSSGAVYGKQPASLEQLSEETEPYPDIDPFKAAYSAAKRSAEKVVERLAMSTGVRSRVARCFAFVGPWLPLNSHFAVGSFMGDALRRDTVRVFATDPVIRSYLHSDDLAVWLLTLATAEGRALCEVFNVGSDDAIWIEDLAGMVAALAGVDVALPDRKSPISHERLDSTDRYVPDISKASREMGLHVKIPLRDAVERTYRVLSGGIRCWGSGRSQVFP